MDLNEEEKSWKEKLFPRRNRMKKALQVIQAYKAVFLSKDGQLVLEDLAEKCKMLEPVTDVSNPNGFSVTSAFFDGKRAAFLDVVKMLGYKESQLVELLKDTERNYYG